MLFHRLIIFFGFLLLVENGCGSSTGGGGSSTSTAASTNAKSSPSEMSAGDVLYMDVSGGSGTVSFSGVSSSASFSLVLQNTSTSGSTSSFSVASLSAQGKSLPLLQGLEEDAALEEGVDSLQSKLEGFLRTEEAWLEGEPWVWGDVGVDEEGSSSLGKSVSKSVGKSVDVALSVGGQETFRVLDSLTDATQYVTVTAEVRCVNDKVAIYVDTEILSTNPGDLTQANVDSLCSIYKDSLNTVTDVLGGYPDINSDGVVVALITPQLNRLGTSSGGVIVGLYYSGDLFARSGSIPASNEREIVYLVSPDSQGTYGIKISNSFAMSNYLPGTFAHEFQHLINYYQHTIVRSGGAEASWLNEAISHLMEDYVGYGRENYSRYDIFLNSPQSYSVVTTSSPNLGQRGAAYLFLRYLYERSGKSTTFLKNLVQTTNTGVTNVEKAYAGSSSFDQMDEFLRQWAVALAYTNSGLTSNADFLYESRSLDGSTGNWKGVCMVCSAQDGRSTSLTGPTFGTYSAGTSYTIKGSAARFLNLSSIPSQLKISDTASEGQIILLRTK